MMRRLSAAGLVMAAWFALVAGAAGLPPYLFDQLKKPVYLQAFNRLFKGEQNLEPWLKRYIKLRDGADAPMQTRQVQDQTYELYEVCKPHNCMGNSIYVLFVPGGAQAWALFTKDDGSTRFFGNPDADLQGALKAAVQ
jgi:hypothetical protein